jgi:hypothetical protein
VTDDKVHGPGGVAGGERVTDRLVRRPGQPMPGARARVQGRPDVRLGPGQLTSKRLREEMVIAVPLPIVIERHEEEVLPLEDVDDLRRVGGADDGVAQRRAVPAENGGAREELAHLARLAAEHLLGETARSDSLSSTPETLCTRAAASAGANRSSGTRISAISPTARKRPIGSGGSARVISTISADGGR